MKEAPQLAIALNDTRAIALINAAYGRVVANGGAAHEKDVERIREVLSLVKVALTRACKSP